ncbi:hypothetical protein TNCV_4525731 [Trichonephila clavipes]|nr:hypothetical protein TNCV_4525731 [Trichonephila clavipes]
MSLLNLMNNTSLSLSRDCHALSSFTASMKTEHTDVNEENELLITADPMIINIFGSFHKHLGRSCEYPCKKDDISNRGHGVGCPRVINDKKGVGVALLGEGKSAAARDSADS